MPDGAGRGVPAAQRREKFASLFSADEGVALIVVLGVLLVLSILAAAVLHYAADNSRGATYSGADAAALTLAEAGLNDALSTLASAPDPTASTALPGAATPRVEVLAGGTVSWSGSLPVGSTVWTITSAATVANPTGGSPVARTVSEQVQVPVVADNPAWGYLYMDNPAGCLALSSSVQVSEPLYIRGNLCLSSSARVLASASPTTVVGTIDTTSTAGVGSSGAPLAQLHVGRGCRFGGSGAYAIPCGPAQQVYTSAQDTLTGTVTKPPLNLGYWYAHATPGPQNPCSTGTFPPRFDNDGALNGSLGNVDLFPASGYDCRVVAGGTTIGRISWSPATKSLVVTGVIFVDGNILEGGATRVTYTGRGTIYASGTIQLTSAVQVCAVRSGGGCDFATGAWDPETSLLVLVAGFSGTSSVSISSNAMFQGALYAAGDYSQSSTAQVQGPVIANNISLASSTQARWAPFTTLAPGMPSGGISIVPGTWHG
jgi:hypothetical protein